MPTVDEILEGKDICICAGSGGVGKTTTSAAIAAGMAARGLQGLRADDRPGEAARRLARPEGARQRGRGRSTRSCSSRSGVEMKGELWAMMLDAKATFDELVARHAPDEESRDRVLDNRIYQQISNALAGSQEYMAMEKLFELHSEGRFDLLVLDTPPTRNALDFLDAPEAPHPVHRGPLAAGLHEADRASRRKVAGRGASVALRRAEADRRLRPARRPGRVLQRLQRHGRRLPGARQAGQQSCSPTPHTCFLVVCGPQGEPIDEAVYFHRKLVEAKLPFGGVIVNKVHYPAERLRGDGDDLPADLARAARRRPGRAGRRELRRLPGAGRARRRATSSTSRSELRSRGRDPRPLPGRGRPRPRRPGRDQPLPVRVGGAARGAGCLRGCVDGLGPCSEVERPGCARSGARRLPSRSRPGPGRGSGRGLSRARARRRASACAAGWRTPATPARRRRRRTNPHDPRSRVAGAKRDGRSRGPLGRVVRPHRRRSWSSVADPPRPRGRTNRRFRSSPT